MSKKMASVILSYGVALAGLSLVVPRLAPAFAKVTLITGVAGGGLCLLWGVIALAGWKRRAWIILTMVALGFALLSQAVQVWMSSTPGESASLSGRLLLTLMFLMTLGVLMYVLYAERPQSFFSSVAVHRDSSPPRETNSPGAGRRGER